MQQKELNDLGNKLKSDEKFRNEFLKSPVEALKKSGYVLTADQEKKLKDMSAEQLKSALSPAKASTDGCGTYHCIG